MNDKEFLHAFETAVLPRAEWTHEAHVRMGFLTLRRMSFADALLWVRHHIRCYNAANGNHTGYHETITTVSTFTPRKRISIFAVPSCSREGRTESTMRDSRACFSEGA